jgi:hypothetical protein
MNKAPWSVSGLSNPQGLDRSSSPDEWELKEKQRAQQAELQRKQEELARQLAEEAKSRAPARAMFRGYHPVTHEALYSYRGETLTLSQVPKGIQVEEIRLPARPPVV